MYHLLLVFTHIISVSFLITRRNLADFYWTWLVSVLFLIVVLDK